MELPDGEMGGPEDGEIALFVSLRLPCSPSLHLHFAPSRPVPLPPETGLRIVCLLPVYAGFRPPLIPENRDKPGGRTLGRSLCLRAHTAGADNRRPQFACRPSSADCASNSFAGSRSPAKCRALHPHQAYPCARETGGHKQTAIQRSGADLRHKLCRKPATTYPNR